MADVYLGTGGQGGTLEPCLLPRIGAVYRSSEAPPAGQPVTTEDNQWEPLWGDVVRVAERLLTDAHARHQPHFLGAVVLQQLQNPSGTMQERTIIDGQQRLTTLQLLLDALHAELLVAGAEQPAMRVETLVMNALAGLQNR